jgi:uncharacterized protein
MDDVRVVMTKWGGQAHWEFDTLRLGSDEHGTWLGADAGTRCTRPGADFCSEQPFVVLVPDAGGFLPTFYGPGGTSAQGTVDVYVDITTDPTWDIGAVRMVDLDLDVVRGRTGRTWVDDEDEFADHRVRLGYPADVVRRAVATCAEVLEAVTSRRSPYDGIVSERWLATLQAARMRR